MNFDYLTLIILNTLNTIKPNTRIILIYNELIDINYIYCMCYYICFLKTGCYDNIKNPKKEMAH